MLVQEVNMESPAASATRSTVVDLLGAVYLRLINLESELSTYVS